MRKDWKYIMYVGGGILLYLTVRLLAPQQFNWAVTLAHEDKNPYGTFALNDLLPGIFSGKRVVNSNQTLYELKDSMKAGENIIALATRFKCEKEDANALLDHVSRGGNAFISAHFFWGHFADTLNLVAYDYFFAGDGQQLGFRDSTDLKFTALSLDTTTRYWFKTDNIHNYFHRFDTTRTTVIARNTDGRPVTIKMKWGKGALILNTTPLVFTNIYVLSQNNHEFVSGTLSYLPERDTYWTEYYHRGRMEAETPLRFVLTSEPLAWAYFLTIAAILLFMFFEAKRKQRVIPVMAPPSNTSLEFVSTIGNLFYENGDHKNMAEKKINFLLEQIRTRYLLRTNEFNDDFMNAVASKSGNSLHDVQTLFRTIMFIHSSTMISAGQLMDLNDKIERFFEHK